VIPGIVAAQGSAGGGAAGTTDQLFAVGAFATPLSTGNQDITLASISDHTPKAALFFPTVATEATTIFDDAFIGRGAADGTNEFALCTWSQHGAAGNTNHRAGVTDACVLIEDASGIIAEASFVSFIPGGIRINWTTVDASNSYKCLIVLLAGDNLSAQAGTTLHPAAGTTVSLGFEPEIIFTFGYNDTIPETTSTEFSFSEGITTWDGATILDQGVATVGGLEGASASGSEDTRRLQYYSNAVSGAQALRNATTQYLTFVTAVDATSFTIRANNNNTPANTHQVGYLALSWVGDVAIHFDDFTAPFSGSPQTVSGVGFRPTFVYAVMNYVPSTNGFQLGIPGYGPAIASAEDGNFSACFVAKHNWPASAPNTTQEFTSMSETVLRKIASPTVNGSIGEIFQFNPDGFDLNWSENQAWDSPWPFLCLAKI